MALAFWARSAAGTNLSFIKEAVKSWREILQQTVLRKNPKTQLQKADVLHRDQYLKQIEPYHYQPKSSNSLASRVFRSLMSSSTARLLSRDLLRRSALFSRGGARNNIPIFTLIGITLGLDVDNLMDGNKNAVQGIKNSFERYTWVPETLQKAPQCLDDMHINTEHFLASGCEGVVYEAKVKADTETQVEHPENYDLALKAVFNYGIESNASSIFGGLGREMIPLQCCADIATEDHDGEIRPALSTQLPPHPNIVEMPSVFVDNVLVTEEGLRTFPAAMPHQRDPSQCFGRNKTMYLVMKRTTNNLRTYLSENPELPMATRCLLLAQLLEGVSHLVSNGIAHRDLKSDNLLVDLPGPRASPRLEICDFGCCLAEKDKKMKVQFPSLDLFRGGNDWLMAPEIRNAVPGPEKYLDFGKSDLWAVGAIAYEILGLHNPFYPSPENPSRRLRNTNYLEDDLPPLPDDVPDPIKRLVRSLLSQDPKQRPSVGVAATVAQMVILSFGKNGSHPTRKRLNSKNTKPRQRVICGGYTGCRRFLPLTKEELLFQKIWIHSLALYSFLTLKKTSEKQETETVNSFVFLSRLTYAEFRASLKFF